MPVTVVVYDAESVLPPTFVRDEGLGHAVVLVSDLAEAHRIARPAEVLVIVGSHDQAGPIGLLTSSAESHTRTVLLYLADAQHQRRVMIHGARRGATVMIGQSPGILAACLRDLVARPPFCGRRTIYRTTGSAMSEVEVCLLILTIRRAARRRGRGTS
jgi:hypothetical protein